MLISTINKIFMFFMYFICSSDNVSSVLSEKVVHPNSVLKFKGKKYDSYLGKTIGKFNDNTLNRKKENPISIKKNKSQNIKTKKYDKREKSFTENKRIIFNVEKLDLLNSNNTNYEPVDVSYTFNVPSENENLTVNTHNEYFTTSYTSLENTDSLIYEPIQYYDNYYTPENTAFTIPAESTNSTVYTPNENENFTASTNINSTFFTVAEPYYTSNTYAENTDFQFLTLKEHADSMSNTSLEPYYNFYPTEQYYTSNIPEENTNFSIFTPTGLYNTTNSILKPVYNFNTLTENFNFTFNDPVVTTFEEQILFEIKIANYLQILKAKKYVFLICLVAPELTSSFLNISDELIFKFYKENIKELAELLEKYIQKLDDLDKKILAYKNKSRGGKYVYKEFYAKFYTSQIKTELYEILFKFFSIAKNTRPIICTFYNLFIFYNNISISKDTLRNKKYRLNIVKKFIIFLNFINETEYKKIELKFFEIYVLSINNTLKNHNCDFFKFLKYFRRSKNVIFLCNSTVIIKDENFFLFFKSFVDFEKNIYELLKEDKNKKCYWNKVFNLSSNNNNDINIKLESFFTVLSNDKKVIISKQDKNYIFEIILMNYFFEEFKSCDRIILFKKKYSEENILILKILDYKQITDFFRLSLEKKIVKILTSEYAILYFNLYF